MLSAAARFKLGRVQEELSRLEQQSGPSTPALFARGNPGVEALRNELKHLEGMAQDIRKELDQSK